MDPTAKLRPVDGIEVNELPDGYVIYDGTRDRVHYLNETAVFVLELLKGDVAAGELASLVQVAYGLEEPPIAEVSSCIERLVAEGLVR